MKILITGATSGIGYEVAKELIKKNHTLYLATHTQRQCEALKRRLRADRLQATCLKLDVTDSNDYTKIDDIDIDCFWGHAGIGRSGSIFDTKIEALREVYEVNIFGNFTLLQRVYNQMINKNKNGKIFVTSSLASMLPIPYLGYYCSSKAAISMLLFTMREELKNEKTKIQISLIEPGAYHTGFNQVMIDHKGQPLEGKYSFIKEEKITHFQRFLFSLMEKKNLTSIVRKIVREIESPNPNFKVRAPFSQTFFAKLFLLIFR